LERWSHGSFHRARGEITVSDFLAGLIELGLYLISQFKLIFEVIINPRSISARESRGRTASIS
jgi:hypothetical protein